MFINLLSNALIASQCDSMIKMAQMHSKVINVVCDGRAVLMLVSSEDPLPAYIGDLFQATNDGVTMFVIHDHNTARLDGKAMHITSLDEVGRTLTLINEQDTVH
jgi:hypothetical protein